MQISSKNDLRVKSISKEVSKFKESFVFSSFNKES